jgi:hypothetical protein
MVTLVVVLSLAAGCAKAAHDESGGSKPAGANGASKEDFAAKASDFTNVHEMTHVRGFYVTNKAGHVKQAVSIARQGHGTYPVGTIIQLVPQEAMVKRRAGFDPASRDWEFFELDISKAGTKIHDRGGAEVVNRFGAGSCADCHRAAGSKYDFVCETTHGCMKLPFGPDFMEKLQESDPRPLPPS